MGTQVVLVSGHRTDDPDRPKPRFPETTAAVDAVRDQISKAFERWTVGPDWTVVTGGARGADLLAAEVALERGAEVHLCLALEPKAFVDRSVRATDPHPALAWEELFRRIQGRARVDVLPPPGSPWNGEASVFTRANDWMLEELQRADKGRALLVWDGRPGFEGGTGKLAAQIDEILRRVRDGIQIIDPTPRAYVHRQARQGQKKILSLDGGGLRAVITLEILAELEAQLRARTGRDDLVLADYFDYLAGTSTGAIIATGLSLGKSVGEIRDRYHRLGHAVFRPSLKAVVKGARFGAAEVHRQLVDFYDEDLVLGDPRLRTLLLIVLHRTETDSPWLLSNCTNAKYNQTSRLLPRHGPDRNLDLSLLQLIRASTAAPTFFAPETIDVGPHRIDFQDGGVTAFNNPALMAAIMCTLPAYKLQWNKGIDDLLVVSVGTGARAATGRRSRVPLLGALRNLSRLPSVFLNGSAFSQDLLCRVIGDCRYGPPIDSEVGDLIGQQFLPDDAAVTGADQQRQDGGIPVVGEYFSYIRYDADLGSRALRETPVARANYKRVRRMDAPDQIPNWCLIGKHAARQVNVQRHFRGFLLPPQTPEQAGP